MWRRVALASALVCAAWAASASAQWGPPPGGGGGRGGPGGSDRERFREREEEMEARAALPLEAMWAVLSFEAGLETAELDSLLGPFRETWGRRAEILSHREKSDEMNWKGVKEEFEDMREALDRRIEALLTESQRHAYDDRLKAYEKGRPSFGPRD